MHGSLSSRTIFIKQNVLIKSVQGEGHGQGHIVY